MYDPTDEAIAAYLGQIGADSEVISKVITRSKVNHDSGYDRTIHRYVLNRAGRDTAIYAKRLNSSSLVAKEFKMMAALSEAINTSTARVPDALYCSDQVLVTAAFPGTPFPQALGTLRGIPGPRWRRIVEKLEVLFTDLGGWLASFHDNSSLGQYLHQASRCTSLEDQVLKRVEDHIFRRGGRHLPRSLLNSLDDRLRRDLADRRLRSFVGPTHGDFCPEQLIVDITMPQIGIVDFEDAHIGHQVWDVAQFCAKLRLMTLRYRNPWHPSVLQVLEERFLEGYGAYRSIDWFTLDRLRLVELLRISTPLQSRQDSGWRKRAKSWLRRMRYRHLIRSESTRVWNE